MLLDFGLSPSKQISPQWGKSCKPSDSVTLRQTLEGKSLKLTVQTWIVFQVQEAASVLYPPGLKVVSCRFWFHSQSWHSAVRWVSVDTVSLGKSSGTNAVYLLLFPLLLLFWLTLKHIGTGATSDWNVVFRSKMMDVKLCDWLSPRNFPHLPGHTSCIWTLDPIMLHVADFPLLFESDWDAFSWA